MLDLLLQTTTETDPWDELTNFNFVDAFVGTYADPLGIAVVGLLVFGGIALAIYISTGDVRIPVVLLLLTGGVTLGQMASPAVGIAVIMLLLTGAGVITYIFYSYR